MYRPSTYNAHNESLSKFIEIFNNSTLAPNIIIEAKETEDFQCDGYFVDTNTNKKIGFDWEMRDDSAHFSNGKLMFSDLAQFGRKIDNHPDIDITLQADVTQTAVAVAWHDDFRNGKRIEKTAKTDSEKKQEYIMYKTNDFWIIRYDEINKLKQILLMAFATGKYNKANTDAIGICPNCNKPIVQQNGRIYCTGKCDMVIGKKYQTVLSAEQVASLLNGQSVVVDTEKGKLTLLPEIEEVKYHVWKVKKEYYNPGSVNAWNGNNGWVKK